MANVITSCRIIFSLIMLFFHVPSRGFYFLYLLCGLTDIVDGTIARKTKNDSKFGAKLDTVADFIFVIVCFIKILPTIFLPVWLIVWIIFIGIIKICSVIIGFRMKKRIIVEHTILNKATGFCLFLFPLSSFFFDLRYSSVVICSIATISAIQEGYYILKGKEIM